MRVSGQCSRLEGRDLSISVLRFMATRREPHVQGHKVSITWRSVQVARSRCNLMTLNRFYGLGRHIWFAISRRRSSWKAAMAAGRRTANWTSWVRSSRRWIDV